jgi:tetratricopeptide (TPR) repeat protein
MTKYVKSSFYALGLLTLSNCYNNDNNIVDKDTNITDSLKVFFLNIGKNKIDSLDYKTSREFLVSLPSNKIEKILEDTEDKDSSTIIKLLDKVKEKDSLSYQYYSTHASLLSLSGKPTRALRILNLSSGTVKNKSKYYFDKACIWADIQPLRQRDSVYYYLKRAVLNDSLNGFYYAARARFFSEDGLYNQMMEDINKAIGLDPKDTGYINQRGAYKLILEDNKGALKDMENVAHQNMKNAMFYLSRAMANHKLKKRKEALMEANKCLSLDSTIAKAYMIRGSSKSFLGDKEGGFKDIETSAKLGDLESIDFLKRNKH